MVKDDGHQQPTASAPGARVVLVRLLALAAWLVAGCVQTQLVICDDGRACPIGTVCDVAHAGCATADQFAACTGAADGDRCEGTLAGLCDSGVCLPGCGDGVQSTNEQCDDGNAASHDGCSSSCELESLEWSPWQDPAPWTPRTGHVAAYDQRLDHLIVFGGSSPAGIDGTAWERSYGFFIGDNWRRLGASPPARQHAAMAFDAARGVTVLVGGIDGLPGIGTVLADTWEYDGATWQQRTPVTSPPARFSSAMTYDAARSVIVMYGGIAADGTYLADTWEYNGTTWSPRTPAGSPPPRANHSLAWDADRGVAVAFGGADDSQCETWELSSTGWAQVTTSAKPPCRSDTAMAFLPARHAVVVFGGSPGFFSSPASDTWEYDATGWHQVLGGVTTPPGRSGHTLTYDATANALVLVGGTSDGLLADVWQFYGDGTWGRQNPSFGSPRPSLASLSYDPVSHDIVSIHGVDEVWRFDGARWNEAPRSQPAPDARLAPGFAWVPTLGVVMFGGAGNAGSLGDCWAWRDGWTELTGTPRPPPRVVPSMAYSEKDGVLVLFGGGELGSTTAFGDTWELANGTWRQLDVTGVPHPAPQRGGAMAYDVARERIVLFGQDGTTWVFRDHAWSQLAPVHSPPPRSLGGLVYDPRRGTMVLIGGAFDERIAVDDAWELDGDDWHVLQLANPPPPRLLSGFAYHAPSRAIVMFGGSTGTSALGDTWLLRYKSSTPDEQCANGIDDDSDSRVDAFDPDCP